VSLLTVSSGRCFVNRSVDLRLKQFRVPSSATEIYHESSYSAFESGPGTEFTETGERVLNRGRKTYGSFVPDVEVYLKRMVLWDNGQGTFGIDPRYKL